MNIFKSCIPCWGQTAISPYYGAISDEYALSQPILPFDTHSLTRGLSEEDKIHIQEQINQLIPEQRELVFAFNENPKIIEELTNFEIKELIHAVSLVALEDFFEGKISEDELAGKCLFYLACNQLILSPKAVVSHPIEDATWEVVNSIQLPHFIPYKSLINAYSVYNETDKQFIIEMLKHTFNIDDDKICESIIDQMKDSSVFDSCIFTINLPYQEVFSWSPLYAGLNRAWDCFHPMYNPKSITKNLVYPNPTLFVLPSMRFIKQAFHQICQTQEDSDPAKFCYTLGECEATHRQETYEETERTIELTVPGQESKTLAKGYYGGPLICALKGFCPSHIWHKIEPNEQQIFTQIEQVVTASLPNNPKTSCCRFFQRKPNFDAFALTSSLNKEDRANILDEINLLTPEQKELVLAFDQNPEIINKLSNDQIKAIAHTLPLIALKEFFKGQISEDEFAGKSIFYVACKQFFISPEISLSYLTNNNTIISFFDALDLESIPLSSVIKAYNIHEETNKEFIYAMLKHTFHLENEEDCKILLEQMKSSSTFDSYIFTFTLPHQQSIAWSPIYEALNQVWDCFHPMPCPQDQQHPSLYDEAKMFVLPSASLIKQAFKIIYKETINENGLEYVKPHAIKFRYILGSSKTTDIEHYKEKDERVIELGIPGKKLKTAADGYLAGPLFFIFHDFYHAYTWSVIKKNERKALMRINTVLKIALMLHPHNNEIRKMIKKEKWRLIDGELYDSVRYNIKFGRVFDLKNEIPLLLRKYILFDMIVFQDLWQNKFQLNRNDLHEREQDMYDRIKSNLEANNPKTVEFKEKYMQVYRTLV